MRLNIDINSNELKFIMYRSLLSLNRKIKVMNKNTNKYNNNDIDRIEEFNEIRNRRQYKKLKLISI